MKMKLPRQILSILVVSIIMTAPVKADVDYSIMNKIELEIFEKTFFEKDKINFMGGILALQENRHLFNGGLELQYEIKLRQEYSYSNKHSIVYNDKNHSFIGDPEPTFLDATDAVLDAIIGNNRIVILHEKHHYPIHRGFAEILLLALQRKGFRHLAAETFTENAKSPDLRYPTIYLGNYSREPMFGHFIRRALSAGFKLIHYEYQGEGTDVASRELGQAKNLVERFFSKTSDQEKLFVYVGYSHVREKQNASTHVWMAQKLKELTGIDPLTINQFWLRPSDTINTVSIAMAEGNFWQPLGNEGAVDIYIAYPEYGPKLDNEIAERLNRTRFDYVIDEFPTPYVVELHATDEYEESNGTSIPFNIHLVENPVDLQRYSYIYSGNSYVLVYKNDVGLVLKKTNLGHQGSE